MVSDTNSSEKKRSPVRRLAIAVVVSVIIVCSGLYLLVSSYDDSSPTNTSPTSPTPTANEANNTITTNTSPPPTADEANDTIQTTPTEDVMNTPSPIPTEKDSALLPGLKPADVTVNLEQRGFICNSAEEGQLYYLRTCNKDTSDYSLHVEIYGRELFSVDLIDSTVLQFGTPDNEFTASFLGFMATMPYDGATQEEARDWVETTLPTLQGEGDVREKVFAGVNYRLFGLPTAITLEMGDLP
jgi:hypothetical protein